MAPYTSLSWVIYLGLFAFALYILCNFLAEGVEETLYDIEEEEEFDYVDDDDHYGDGWIDEFDGPIYEEDVVADNDMEEFHDYHVDAGIAKLEQFANGKS